MTTVVLDELLRYTYVVALLPLIERASVIVLVALLPFAAWSTWRFTHRPASRSAPTARVRALPHGPAAPAATDERARRAQG
jgi:hypothetical protein